MLTGLAVRVRVAIARRLAWDGFLFRRRRLLLLAPPEGLLLSDHSPGYVLLPWMCTVRDIAPSIDEILIHYVLDDSP